MPTGSSITPSCGGYGGLLDCNGVLWSSGGNSNLLRYVAGTPSGVCLPGTFYYGLGFSGQTGSVWASLGNTVYELDANGAVLQSPTHTGSTSKGLAVDNTGTVWVAHGDGAQTVGRLASDGSQQASVTVGSGPTGVAVDRNGKVWVSNRFSDNIMRINPTPAPGVVDMTVPLGTGSAPYNYSDMTGMVGLHTTGTGTWNVVHDGIITGTPWYRVLWNQDDGCFNNANDPPIVVDVRADDNRAALPTKPYVRATTNGMIFSSGTVVGRFVEIRVRLTGSCAGTTYDSPSLCSLTLQPVYPACCKADTNFNGCVDNGSCHEQTVVSDLQEFSNIWQGGGPPCHTTIEKFCRADLNDDGRIDNYDLQQFIHIIITGNLPEECPCENCNFGTPGFHDCNNNQIDDYDEIAQNPDLDCNLNGFLDACDVVLWAPWGATDCNDNDVPDECDIKWGTSEDCNENGIPDSCDIAVHTSRDVNRNGIPDECDSGIEEMTMMSMPACPTAEDLNAAWAAFYAWSLQQCWGPNCPLTGAEQYQAIVDKKCELGLPIP